MTRLNQANSSCGARETPAGLINFKSKVLEGSLRKLSALSKDTNQNGKATGNPLLAEKTNKTDDEDTEFSRIFKPMVPNPYLIKNCDYDCDHNESQGAVTSTTQPPSVNSTSNGAASVSWSKDLCSCQISPGSCQVHPQATRRPMCPRQKRPISHQPRPHLHQKVYLW